MADFRKLAKDNPLKPGRVAIPQLDPLAEIDTQNQEPKQEPRKTVEKPAPVPSKNAAGGYEGCAILVGGNFPDVAEIRVLRRDLQLRRGSDRSCCKGPSNPTTTSASSPPAGVAPLCTSGWQAHTVPSLNARLACARQPA